MCIDSIYYSMYLLQLTIILVQINFVIRQLIIFRQQAKHVNNGAINPKQEIR